MEAAGPMALIYKIDRKSKNGKSSWRWIVYASNWAALGSASHASLGVSGIRSSPRCMAFGPSFDT